MVGKSGFGFPHAEHSGTHQKQSKPFYGMDRLLGGTKWLAAMVRVEPVVTHLGQPLGLSFRCTERADQRMLLE